MQLAKYLNKDLLRKIFRFRRIASDSQAHCIDSSVMKLVEFFEREQITSYHFYFFDRIFY